MYQPDAELLFPARVIPFLQGLRGKCWDELVNSVCEQPDGSLDEHGFSLMMIRNAGCMTCHAGSHRARLGCTACAQQVTRRYKGSDDDLTVECREARDDVEKYLLRGSNKTRTPLLPNTRIEVEEREL